jgi:hypothetical protein
MLALIWILLFQRSLNTITLHAIRECIANERKFSNVTLTCRSHINPTTSKQNKFWLNCSGSQYYEHNYDCIRCCYRHTNKNVKIQSVWSNRSSLPDSDFVWTRTGGPIRLEVVGFELVIPNVEFAQAINTSQSHQHQHTKCKHIFINSTCRMS